MKRRIQMYSSCLTSHPQPKLFKMHQSKQSECLWATSFKLSVLFNAYFGVQKSPSGVIERFFFFIKGIFNPSFSLKEMEVTELNLFCQYWTEMNLLNNLQRTNWPISVLHLGFVDTLLTNEQIKDSKSEDLWSSKVSHQNKGHLFLC